MVLKLKLFRHVNSTLIWFDTFNIWVIKLFIINELKEVN